MLAVYEQFACAAASFRPLQMLLHEDPQLAQRILTSRTGHVHPAMVNAIHALLGEEYELGALATPKSELRNLAYAIVRMAEAFLYNDAMLATEPQIHRSTRIVGRLMVCFLTPTSFTRAATRSTIACRCSSCTSITAWATRSTSKISVTITRNIAG